jgi:hypothetical protein
MKLDVHCAWASWIGGFSLKHTKPLPFLAKTNLHFFASNNTLAWKRSIRIGNNVLNRQTQEAGTEAG